MHQLRQIVCALVAVAVLWSGPSAAQETTTYQYDSLGRLIIATHAGATSTDITTTIGYDPAGNRSNYTVANGDAPAPPAAIIAIGNASATEGQNLVFPVTRSGNTAIVLNVNYTTQDGSALAGSDYTASGGSVYFASGQTSATIVVPTTDDVLRESTETMGVVLSGASGGATISNGSAIGSILDNDANVDGWASALTSGEWTYCDDFNCYQYDGYWPARSIGSMSSTTFNGATIVLLTSSDGFISLGMTGSTVPPNSGWTSITIPGVGTLNRAAASYTPSGTGATWTWNAAGTITTGTVTIR